MSTKLTASRRGLLTVLAAAGDKGCSGREIAEAMYPDSPGWNKRTSRRGWNNGALGGTMPMQGAKRAWEAIGDGQARHDAHLGSTVFHITEAGRTALDNDKAGNA